MLPERVAFRPIPARIGKKLGPIVFSAIRRLLTFGLPFATDSRSMASSALKKRKRGVDETDEITLLVSEHQEKIGPLLGECIERACADSLLRLLEQV